MYHSTGQKSKYASAYERETIHDFKHRQLFGNGHNDTFHYVEVKTTLGPNLFSYTLAKQYQSVQNMMA